MAEERWHIDSLRNRGQWEAKIRLVDQTLEASAADIKLMQRAAKLLGDALEVVGINEHPFVLLTQGWVDEKEAHINVGIHFVSTTPTGKIREKSGSIELDAGSTFYLEFGPDEDDPRPISFYVHIPRGLA